MLLGARYCASIEELDYLHNDDLGNESDTTAFLDWMSTWHVFWNCGVHIAMTSQEHACRLEACAHDADKLKLVHILLESVRRHFADVAEKSLLLIGDMQFRASGRPQWEVPALQIMIPFTWMSA